ncbi:MAG: hypoxanthine phosphoribosyltransferase [Acidimicrobiales bacterium]|jgi:hypoxanthine phosphoribosyltransferase|nr:hypoxanthine phosphoribosyltransferase [Acidimicrobiales bacterium]MDP6894419.1 hypoxanthine phosphoribosyltransferase [Acidimicrobiales bacterium]HJM37970.1 hypoxanthine phosphoribosyltransferase [Acidimicrobiales bacterium]|tara:strand:- start:195 stop:794 length:600 start_codon:yes stop_codon:yes gene_type:complete
MDLPKLLQNQHEIDARVRELAVEIDDYLSEGDVVVGVLKGCLPFLADLVRKLNHEIETDFLALTSFQENTGRVRLTRDLGIDVSGRNVLLVEDVVDTGFRLDFLRRHLETHEPAEVRVCTLFDRSDRRILPVKVEYSGFVLQEGFIVGYGIDHLGMFRNLPSVVTANQALLDEEFARGESKLADEIVKIARGKEQLNAS